MALYDLPNATTGIDAIIVDTATSIPMIVPMLLLFVFGIVLLGGSSSQKRRTGYSDIPFWSVLASISTLMICLPLTLISDAINIITLSVVVVITLLSGLWYFMNRNRYEV